AAQRFKDSQPLIQNNFLDIQNAFSLNHVDFNLGVETGKHKFLQMPAQGAAPATNATEMGLYTKNGIFGTPEMFIRRQGSGLEISFTEKETNGVNNGWTRLPSGIILKWGFAAPVGTGPSTIVFPISGTIPVFNNLYNVQLTIA